MVRLVRCSAALTPAQLSDRQCPLLHTDDSIYLAMHSTVLPPPPPAASSGSAADTRNGSIVQPGGATGTAEILAGLGIDVDLPNLTGVTPLPDATATDETHAIAAGDLPLAQESEEELPSGDETFIEVVEITADFLVGEHTSASCPCECRRSSLGAR